MNKHPFVKSGEPGCYRIDKTVTEQEIMAMAQVLVGRRFKKRRIISSTTETKSYLTVKLAGYEHEVFGVIFLDSQNGILEVEHMFKGTIDSAPIFPREVVKKALKLNAANLIFYHNHPGGNPEPSFADRNITKTLRDALLIIDVKVLDHLVVGGAEVVSFAERGLI